MRIQIAHLASLADVKAIEATPLTDQNLPESTYALIQEAGRLYADAPAIEFLLLGGADEETALYSYTDLARRVTQAANLFHSHFTDPAKRGVIAIVLPNLPQTEFAIWGAEAAGIAQPINPLLEAEVIAEMLKETQAEVLVTLAPTPSVDIWEKVASAAPHVPSLRAIYTIDPLRFLPGVEDARPQPGGLSIPVQDFDDASAEQPGDRLISERQIAPHEIAAYFHTGGTTGAPKIAPHTHAMQVLNAAVVAGALFKDQAVIFAGLPFFHVNGMMVTGLGAIAGGGHAVMLTPQGYRNKAIIENFWKLVERFKANFFSAVPTVFSALLEVPHTHNDLSSLQYALSGAAPMPVDLFERFERETGVKILEGFGMTEGTCVNSVNPPQGERRIGSIGLRIPYMEIKTALLDEQGAIQRDCDPDEIGTVLMKGPNVFAGYTQEARNEGVFTPCGWFNTGDLGRQDQDGYLWLTGREKDLIIRGGHNIDPSVIEETLARHPAVALVAAIGQPDAYAGELPIAYVSLRPGVQATADEIQAFGREEISERAAVPVRVELIEEMPVTAVGKIFKPVLRRQAADYVLRHVLHGEDIGAEISVDEHKVYGTCATIKLPKAQKAAAEKLLGGFAIQCEFVTTDG